MESLGQLTAALSGRYVVEREIGRGGMAVVYLARDLRHDRRVALKVLKPELGAVLGVERFLTEIQVTANLQHPNLLPLFDSGSADGLLFYIMPFVEGESLRAWLQREKQLPVDEAVRVAVAVAGALDYAHRHGVVHRDLKPENILVHEGQPLIADFGIALAVSRAGGERITQSGLSLGTPQYMSPEQATGDRAVDGRTDVYSLAAVTYEMLAGDPPHAASNAQAIIAKLLTERPPDLRTTRPSVPDHVAYAIERALEKLPADRWSRACDFADALLGKAALPRADRLAAAGGSGAAASRGQHERERITARRTRLLAASSVLVAAVLAGVGLWSWAQARQASSAPPMRFAVALPPSIRLKFQSGPPLLLTPDGRTLVLLLQTANSTHLYRRSLDRLDVQPIAGTERAQMPFLSPDGKWVGFWADGAVRKVPLEGGPSSVITETSNFPLGHSWGANDVIVFAPADSAGLSAVSAAGGPRRRFSRPNAAKGETDQRWPLVLPDGKTVLYASWRSSVANARLAVTSLDGGESTILDIIGTYPLDIFEGRLVYARPDGTLMAVPFDVGKRRATGEPVALISGIGVMVGGAARVGLSANGTLAYSAGTRSSRMVLTSPAGTTHALIGEPREFEHPRFSPDGRKIAVGIFAERIDVWVYDIAQATLTRLTSEDYNDVPEWTPDGKRILFRLNRGGDRFAYSWQPADGSAKPERLLGFRDRSISHAIVSPDGRWLVYRDGYDMNGALWYRTLAGDTTSKPLVVSRFSAAMPAFSPDGRWLAYVSDESGSPEVYARPFPQPTARSQISTGGGNEPRWSADGGRIFYRHGQQMLAARVSTTPSFTVLGHDVLFEGPYVSNLVFQDYDVTSDGKQFLMLQPAMEGEQIVVALNWLPEFRQRVRPATQR